MTLFRLRSVIVPLLAAQVLVIGVGIRQTCTASSSSGDSAAKVNADTQLPYETQDVSFSSGQNSLAGRLFVPRGESHIPVVIYVEGSDDGNTNASPYVRALAKGFAKGHIGLFSFNKRGNAGSSGQPTDDFGARAMDVISAYRFLASSPTVDSMNIGLYGISQAGWVIPRSCSTLTNAAFTILVSPAAVSPSEQVTFFLQNQWRKAGMNSQEIVLATELHRTVARYYSTFLEPDYRTAQASVDRVKAESWFGLLNKVEYREEVPNSGTLLTPSELQSANKRDPGEYAYYQSSQTWDPDTTIYRSITIPVLMIYGGQDELVPVERSMTIFQRAFAENGNQDVTFRIFETSGHDIQPVGSPYLTEGYREYMTEWVRHHLRANDRH